jgi:hypothetical protein
MVFGAFPGSQVTIDEENVDGVRMALRSPARHAQRRSHGDPAYQLLDVGQTVLHFRDGRVIERWSTADMLSLLVQLGAVPTHG